ncbi:HesB/IscA family protein [Woodsholea maritima]|uniref:HesB/IscA family protein n=1 Tax=Woodsholea maritima TaxID=240237 RepID=UPI00036D9B0C|nr:iron-sulfur cluster assembly accessory protein [Woodsholea maritima]
MSRPRPKAVTLSERAATRIKTLLERQGKGFLRVGVKNGGCAGMEYTLDYVDAPDPLDERVEDKGVEIVIAGKSLLFLLGSEIDYETTALHSKFVFRNPNQTDACGCGESVTIVPVHMDNA